MSDALTYIKPLNGEEVIEDLCGLIADKLRQDCNLREIDGYSNGYKAKVTLHIELFGFDSASVDTEVEVDETRPDADNPIQEPDDIIHTELEVPQETDLSVVRERSGQSEPNIEITAEGPTAEPQKRKYTRRLKALAAAQGGAAGPMEE